jgi:glucose/arabinose dehydrogenase/uncharacterized protein involved in tolerance to divalent cations
MRDKKRKAFQPFTDVDYITIDQIMPYLRLSPLIVSLFSLLKPQPSLAQTEQLPIFINCGGPTYIDGTGGIIWIADANYTTAEVYEDDSPIAGTDDETIYQTQRQEAGLNYEIQVANGIYDVRLSFAELQPEAMAVGSRVFNILLEDYIVLKDIDVYGEVGAYTALTKLATTAVSDGYMTIDFSHVFLSPMVSAIEITPIKASARNTFKPIYINSGGDILTDATGTIWTKDNYFTGGLVERQFGAPRDVSNTVDDLLYQTARYDPPHDPIFKYDIPVPNGSYLVKLHYAEMYSKAQFVGAREFDVSLEGSKVFSKMDIFKEVGGYSALIKSASTKVSDGLLTIGFTHVTENPKVCAIEIHASRTTGSEVHMNVGGGTFVDSTGTTWTPDEYYNSGGEVEKWFGELKTISGTTDSKLYETSRYDPKGGESLAYNIPMPNDNYLVILHFAEVYPGAQYAGARVFDVSIEGTLAFDDLDIYKEAGGYTALKKSFTTIVRDGKLTIELRHVIENPKLSAIEVFPNTASTLPSPSQPPPSPPGNGKVTTPFRINAGGNAFTDTLGNMWVKDVFFNTGGAIEESFGAPQSITGTTNGELYLTSRYDPGTSPSLAYNIPIKNGDYTITLHFSENYPGAQYNGARVFDVEIEGLLAFRNVDIYQEAGKYAALAKTATTTITDGMLTIAFIHGSENPKISAIEVLEGKQVSSQLNLPPGPPQSGQSIYINVGGPTYTNKKGVIWTADKFFNDGGKVETLKVNQVASIAGTTDPVLYQTARYDPKDGSPLKYEIPVPTGKYTTILHFAELYSVAMKKGGRVFDVLLEGVLAFKDLDIFGDAGANTALQKTASNITVTDGLLTISFNHKVENPKLCAIEVHPSSSSPSTPTLPVATPTVPAGKPFSLYINAGGKEAFTDSLGKLWLKDSFYNNGGKSETVPNSIPTIYGTGDDFLYTTGRYDPAGGKALKYEIPVPNGEYTLILHFAEIYSQTMFVGARVFGVLIEQSLAMTVDIYGEVGPFTALKKTAFTKVKDGILSIEFVHDKENPKISAIEVLEGTQVSSSLALPPGPIPTTSSTYFVNIGGGSFKDDTGTTWQADEYFKEGGELEIVSKALAISGTSNDALYQTARYAPPTGVSLKYDFPVPNGDYQVIFHFAEVYSMAFKNGARVFDVLLEGTVVISDLDIHSEVGPNAALTKTAYGTVSDGSLTVEFGRQEGNPKLSAIQIKQSAIPSGSESHRAHAVPGGPYTQTDVDGNNVETIAVDGSFSHTHTPGSSIVSWKWKVDGKVIATGEYTELTIPVGVHTLYLDVVDSDGGESSDFTTVTIKPDGFSDISSLSPTTGDITGGEKITITGSRFGSSAEKTIVHFGSYKLTGSSMITVVNDNMIEVLKAPQGFLGSIEVSVETPVGLSNKQFYTYTQKTLAPVNFLSGSTIGGIYGPTTIAFGPDGKLYIGTQGGTLLKATLDDTYKVIEELTLTSNAIAVSEPASRSILGITFDPMDTSPNPTVYVAHSNLFHGEVVSYNGKVSAVSGANLDTVKHVVTGLPVSDHDHGINGMDFGSNGELYIQIGGNTNAGVPGALSSSGKQDEGVLSAATVVAHLSRKNYDGNVKYDVNENQISGFDVEVFASGERNPFDIVVHSNGNIYGTDNGPNNKYGKKSVDCVTSSLDPNEADELNLLVKGAYYGHANRKRGETDPRQCKWRSAKEASDKEYTAPISMLDSSSNGITEFQTKHFGGQLRGNLLVGRYKGGLYQVVLSADGKSVMSKPSILKKEGGVDVTQGPDGTIFCAENSKGQILYHTPSEKASDLLQVKSVFPRRGPNSGGSILTLYGENFNGDILTISVGGKVCPATSRTATKLTCTLPSGKGPADVMVVVTSNGTKSDVLTKGYRYISGVE